MQILYLLIPIAVVVMAVAIWALVWAIKNGQYDDLEGPAYRILMDDDDPRIPGGSAKSDAEGTETMPRERGRHDPPA
ncbi:MAG: cbb3-type cytochrome oxidase assembly protein CcoS [Gammaproteobacteria bacterium]